MCGSVSCGGWGGESHAGRGDKAPRRFRYTVASSPCVSFAGLTAVPETGHSFATAVPIRAAIDVYDTDVRLIFYDVSVLGPFQEYFDRIAVDRRYTALADNLHHFAAAYARISA
jgi:hypothetical protein